MQKRDKLDSICNLGQMMSGMRVLKWWKKCAPNSKNEFPLDELTGICTFTKLTQILLQTATLITNCRKINKMPSERDERLSRG